MNFNYVLLLVCTMLWSCQSDTAKKEQLKPISKVSLKISEPSGIAYYNNYLYIVSDSKYFIYKTTLKGKVVAKILIKLNGLEGITVDTNGIFYVVDEVKRTVVKLDSTGKILNKAKVKGKQKEKNSGFEGICYNPTSNSFYVLNEKLPKALLHISEDGTILKTINISFAKDVSGISVDKSTNNLWVVSDASQSIYCINEKGEVIQSYKIPVKKPEGIVVLNEVIYVVSDAENTMYTFKKP